MVAPSSDIVVRHCVIVLRMVQANVRIAWRERVKEVEAWMMDGGGISRDSWGGGKVMGSVSARCSWGGMMNDYCMKASGF